MHGNCFLHVDELAHVVAVDEPLPQLPPALPDDAQRAIARRIAGLVPDGATLQVGIGAVPDTVLAELGDRRDLGIHSEVVSDGILDLIEKGVVTGARKAVDPGKVVSSFLTGTQRLYDFVDDNPMVEMHPVDYTNDTRRILQLDNMIAVNSALEIDLTGQVCAESIGPAVYSGVGGPMDFIRGAALSRGGKPIIALPTTAKGGTVSRIAPTLKPGAGVTGTRALRRDGVRRGQPARPRPRRAGPGADRARRPGLRRRADPRRPQPGPAPAPLTAGRSPTRSRRSRGRCRAGPCCSPGRPRGTSTPPRTGTAPRRASRSPWTRPR